MAKELLVTGGAGFIGTNFVKYMLEHTNDHITNIDALTYASNQTELLTFRNHSRHRFFQCDITNQEELDKVFDRKYDAIIHFAAESHVDRSINNAHPFIETNINGTLNLLNAVRNGKAMRMIQISTDEVYGSLDENDASFTETTPLSPNNPYSASKAGADLLVQSYYNTYQLPLIITRCSNNYGTYQHREKFIPMIISNALQGNEIPLYGDGLQIRDWLYVEDHCRAIHLVLEKGKDGEVYNIGGESEQTNLEVAQFILTYLGKNENLIKHVEDRKGHDRRYSINWEKINQELGWKPIVEFKEGLLKTIEWYKTHSELGW